MQPPIRITILMATYNGAEHIGAQLASFAAQDHADWDLWVSDDGSTDNTLDIIAAFAAENPDHDIRILKGPQRGAAANFLHLLCHADLPPGHVAISDQDDIWYPQKLSHALAGLHGVEGPAAYSAQSRHVNRTGQPIGKSRIQNGTPSFANALVQNRVAGHCATLNPDALALLRQVGNVDVPFHDWWIYLLVQGAGGSILVSDDVVLDYRQHSANVLGGNQRRFAAVVRILAVLGPTFGSWHRRNLAALETIRGLLTHEASKTLDDWSTAPRFGLRRATAMHKLGLARDRWLDTQFLKIAAVLGRF